MLENGFSSPRNDTFPAGLRVLVVDDDPTWLKILEKMLKKCSYEVTTCGLARDALKLLRERKDGFDIVISDVYMPDMDGFKLLELVGLEMDLPVIMMSVDGETSRVMKGVQHGACDYLLKPIRMKELRNIWQHVFRKKIQEVRDIEVLECVDGIQMIRNASDHLEDGHFLCGEDLTNARKRKDVESKHDEKELGDSSSTKKARVVWSVDLHQKFVKAVHQIGFDKVGPKKILDLMNVPWLTRENVASHLQKYRLYLSRLQKENDLKSSAAGTKLSESSSKDSAGCFGIQKSINSRQCDVSNGNYVFSGGNLLAQNVDIRSQENDRKRTISQSVEDSNRPSNVDVSDPRKQRVSTSELYHSSLQDHSSTSTVSKVKYAAYDTTFSKSQSWCEIPEIQPKLESSPFHLDDRFRPLHLPTGKQQQLPNEYLRPAPAICSVPSLSERDKSKSVNFKPLSGDHRINMNHPSSTGTASDSIATHIKTYAAINQDVSLNMSSTSGTKNQIINLNWLTDLESVQKNINLDSSTLASLDNGLLDCWIQGDCCGTDLGLQNIEFSEYYDPVVADVPVHLYDALRFDYENLCDPTEYSLTF